VRLIGRQKARDGMDARHLERGVAVERAADSTPLAE
jgi:hypothetical protein